MLDGNMEFLHIHHMLLKLQNKMLPLIIASKNEGIKELLGQEGDLVSKSQWIIGGDGWAYDIG